MALIGRIPTSPDSLLVWVAILAACGLVLLATVKIGGFVLKMILGLAVLGGVIWWFLSKTNH